MGAVRSGGQLGSEAMNLDSHLTSTYTVQPQAGGPVPLSLSFSSWKMGSSMIVAYVFTSCFILPATL